MKLTYAASEVDKYQLEADAGASLTLSALKQTMGLGENDSLELADKKLPSLSQSDPVPELKTAIAEAAVHRPEWAQIKHGKNAADALRQAELRAMAPVLFAAGQLEWDWTPMRDSSDNPYHYDLYNRLFGGAAIGLAFDLDPAAALAKADKAQALRNQVDALERFAESGIPLRVRKAHEDAVRFEKAAQLSKKGVKATRKWMAFAATAYTTGTGEAKDLLEGLVAYVTAKKGYYESLQLYYTARAELEFAVGK